MKTVHAAIFSKDSIISYLVTLAKEHPQFKEGKLTEDHKREIQHMESENLRFKSNSDIYHLCDIGKFIFKSLLWFPFL